MLLSNNVAMKNNFKVCYSYKMVVAMVLDQTLVDRTCGYESIILIRLPDGCFKGHSEHPSSGAEVKPFITLSFSSYKCGIE